MLHEEIVATDEGLPYQMRALALALTLLQTSQPLFASTETVSWHFLALQ
jgi:hypothetical protein